MPYRPMELPHQLEPHLPHSVEPAHPAGTPNGRPIHTEDVFLTVRYTYQGHNAL